MSKKEKKDHSVTKEKKEAGGADSKLLSTLVIAVAAILLLVYVLLAFYFEHHFFLRTDINGVDCSALSLESAQTMISEESKNYTLTLVGSDGSTEEVYGTDINLIPMFDESLSAALDAQVGALWPITFFKENKIAFDTMITYDKDDLKDVLENLSIMDQTQQIAPENAKISRTAGNEFEIVPETVGSVINESALIDAVGDAVTVLTDTLDLTEAGCYEKAQYTADNTQVISALDAANTCAAAEITYEFGSASEVLSADTITDWVVVSDDFTVALDETCVAEYVDSLADTYDTAGKEKEFTTSYGNTVTVPAGSYGWKIDKEAECAQLTEDITSGKVTTREPVYAQTANSRDGDDFGGSYVEINLSAQHLWLYNEGELVLDSDFVSGSIAGKHGTSAGAFSVVSKETERYLVGPDYRSFVHYWMPFNGGEGMHDATWRKSFGGSTYLTSGSHGCINLPQSVAGQIFDNVDVGYCVLVYNDPEHAVATQQQIAGLVINKINAVGTNVSLLTEEQITGARNLYNYMSSDGRAMVTNYDMLLVQEAGLASLKAQMSAQLAALAQQAGTLGNE